MYELLLVEKDAARRDSLVYFLSEAGFRIKALKGADELESTRNGHFDLWIVSDSELALISREGSQIPDGQKESTSTPVLALVNPGDCSAILRTLAAGAVGVISRNRSPEEIVAKVSSVVSDLIVSNEIDVAEASERGLEIDRVTHSALISALQSTCEDVTRLQRRYEEELTQRHKVEQALMESEAFYQSLVETLPLALLRKDLKGRFTFANHLASEAFRRPTEEIIGKTDYDFFPRELAEKYRADDRYVLDQRKEFETTEEFQSPNGDRRYTHVVKTPVYDANGSLVGIQGIFSDVTEKERAEIELHQTKARLQAVLDAATQMSIIAADVNGVIDVFNTGAERMLGYSASEMIGKQTPSIIHLESEVRKRGEEMSREYGRTIEGFDVFVENARQGLHEEREWTYVRKDGSHFPVSLIVTARRDRFNQIVGYLGIAVDISTRKKAEAAMRKAKEEAEAASQAKSDFLANMSHEIRTPLNAVIGMTDLLIGTDMSLSQREYLSMIQESGESLLAVINDILDFSKIEAGKMSLEEIPFDVREVLGDTLKTLALRAHRKNLELACHVAPQVPIALEGDPHRLRQIVINLVGNAIKFTERGEVVLDVDIESRSDDILMLHCQIHDTGIGIPAEKLSTIFEAFEQADTSTTRRYGGTGLGLAIVSRLVRLMEGTVWVESEVNRGSTFHFTGRYRKGSFEDSMYPSDIHPTRLDGLRVLIVDDNTTNRRILTEMLANWAMKPFAVASVAEAIGELERTEAQGKSYGLILTDSNMPVQDGFELARRVRENPSLCTSIIMMLTSAERSEDLIRCHEFGISSYLLKPIKQSELFDAIVAVMDKGSRISATIAASSAYREASYPKLVLLAEDSLINQKLAIGLLERWGHAVVVANDGDEAVRLSGERPYDVILMDVQMPSLDGLDATRAIRARERVYGGHVPIIAMTAHAMKGDRERCLQAGMDGYLMKPIRAEQLYRQIESIVPNHRVSAPESSVPKSPSETRTETLEAAQVHQEFVATGEGQPSFRIDSNVSSAIAVDWRIAERAVNDDQELLDQVVEAFLEEGPQLVSTMQETFRLQEWKRFQRAAHTLKSAFRTFGVGSADRVEKLEMAAKAESVQIDASLLKEVVLSLDPVLEAMRFRLNSRGTSGNVSSIPK